MSLYWQLFNTQNEKIESFTFNDIKFDGYYAPHFLSGININKYNPYIPLYMKRDTPSGKLDTSGSQFQHFVYTIIDHAKEQENNEDSFMYLHFVLWLIAAKASNHEIHIEF
tara:strand:- start:5038 stop:5370 length:333 start_codon:yes stop_codon:yes gene_type:complete